MNTKLLFFIYLIFEFLPNTHCFKLKNFLLRIAGAKIGKNVRICSSVRILGNSTIEIGDNTWIGHKTFIVCSGNVRIGQNVNIAPLCYIGTGTHEIQSSEYESVAGDGYSIPVSIGNGCWLCVRSTILPGTNIGDSSIVAAGAVVKGNVPNHTLVGGVPARIIKEL